VAPSARADLEARRAEVAHLRHELDETNRGLIALYAELDQARAAEARLATIVQSSDDAIFSTTLDHLIDSWNPGAERLLGYRAADILGSQVEVLIPADVRDTFEDALARLRAGVRAMPYDTWCRGSHGTLIEVALTLSAMRDQAGQLIGYSALLHDLSAQRRREAELLVAQATREVSEDRERIARDLHDLVIQRVFAADLALHAVGSLVTAPDVQRRLHAIAGELDAAISEIRSTIFGLKQGSQGATSLRTQVLAAVTRAAESLGFWPRLYFEGPIDAAVPDAVAEHLLAVVRESLINVARHANASATEVSVSVGEDLVLRVTDDGTGLGRVTCGSGLRNLQHRAECLGGTFAVNCHEGGGTCVEWRIPLRV